MSVPPADEEQFGSEPHNPNRPPLPGGGAEHWTPPFPMGPPSQAPMPPYGPSQSRFPEQWTGPTQGPPPRATTAGRTTGLWLCGALIVGGGVLRIAIRSAHGTALYLWVAVEFVLVAAVSIWSWQRAQTRRAALRAAGPTWAPPGQPAAAPGVPGAVTLEVVNTYEWLLRESRGRCRLTVDGVSAGFIAPNGGVLRVAVPPGPHEVRAFQRWHATPPVRIEIGQPGVRLYFDIPKTVESAFRLYFLPRRALYLGPTPIRVWAPPAGGRI